MNYQYQTKIKGLSLNIKQYLIACAIGILVLCSVGCEEQKLNSSWLDREIIIDAKSDDWLDTLYYFESEMVSLGFSTMRIFCISACLRNIRYFKHRWSVRVSRSGSILKVARKKPLVLNSP